MGHCPCLSLFHKNLCIAGAIVPATGNSIVSTYDVMDSRRKKWPKMHTCSIGCRAWGWTANIWAGAVFALQMTDSITPLLGKTRFCGAMGLS